MRLSTYRSITFWPTARWPNFSPVELSCKCRGRFCDGEYWHDPDFLDALQKLRVTLGRPVIVNSAHRCHLWNAAIGGAPLSMHKTLAVDIRLAGFDRHVMLNTAKKLGFKGIGLATNFIHLDRRKIPAIWYYQGSHASWQTL